MLDWNLIRWRPSLQWLFYVVFYKLFNLCVLINIWNDFRAAEIRRKFLEFDKDHNGHVTVEEAHDILRRELAFSPEQSVHLVEKYDKNGDGQLSYEEFVSFYKKIRSK